MSELFPTKTIAIEVVGCTDESKIWQFNYWHDKTLIPELKRTPGIVGVHRYRDTLLDLGEYTRHFSAPAGEPTRYLNLYRINSPKAWSLMQEVKENNLRRAEEAKVADFVKFYELTVWEFVFYRRKVQPLPYPETHLPDGMPEAFMLVTNSSIPGKETDHDDWWLNTHAHDLLEIPGYIQCSRFRSLNPNPPEDEATTCNIYEIDPHDIKGSVMQNLLDDDHVRRPQGRFAGFTHLGATTYARGIYQHWDPM